ncbi:eukaryotic translation initiation factor 2-alpha kinase [Nylanderia fulva]|uniref:eukaryotic translation initiation factor 2-alpha kinase n=1 Tax=Nylanderia fulva TaxID=613905 RepID=UPI0010FB2A26|nr:eukaryotic translation initiation factor 2-alpha kinase [Nylanderia fulva]
MFHSRVWHKKCFHYLVAFVTTYFFISTDGIIPEEQLTLCGAINKRSLVFVSTLDGKISALDAGNHGQKQWTLDFNEGPMLSSSIHNKELNNNGQWIRLIPSLNGGLYKFDGETLESVPLSTDQLLYSSFHYSNDLVFSGGKTLHTYRVSASTGKLLYACHVAECRNNTDREEHLEYDVLIVQRFQQTVRAIEPRTGNERWNFSVGQHNLMFTSRENDPNILDIDIKVVISEGLIWAINKSNPTVKLWQHQFDVPIVSIWREHTSKTSINEGSLEEINLFDDSQWIWRSAHTTDPSLYLGMHERQLYVQENSKFLNSLDLTDNYVKNTKYSWQPHPADVTALTSPLPKESNEVYIDTSEAHSATALSVLYNSDYINGNGFFLYSSDHLEKKIEDNIIKNNNNISIKETIEEETNTPQIIVSFWYWWKEVLIISITTAFVVNFFLNQHLLNVTNATKNTILPPLIVEGHIETKRNDSINESENVNNFKSRYLTDFEPVDCLGKGGYGVVFEAKNKIDDCNYAIKRIALPNSRDSRERVMREVKALAKLDHHNIVRYFNAWLECPPSGWQEEHDQQWINKLKLSSAFPSEVTHTETKPSDSVYINVSQTDPSSVDSACEALELNNVDMNDDSLVVFEMSNEKQYDNDAVCIDACSTDSSNLSFSNNEAEKELSNINDTNDHSESIVFAETDNNIVHSESIVFEKTDNNIIIEEKKHKRQKSFSLNLNKSNNHKSAKMFLYIQMQLCQRLSLREWLKQHIIRDFTRVLNIFQQIVDAVEYVHLQGLIHRDLKPSNIFFAYDDKIKIGDFGLVTAMTESHDATRTPSAENENVTLKNSIHTACVGTHLYMSPEQINGQMYNYKVDIYSLGIIFFELLIPFFTDMERIVALSNLKKSIFPKDFAEKYYAEYNLLKMMLDKDPAKRPTTLGIKARAPLQSYEVARLNMDKDSKWHFELPQLLRNFSVTSSSSNSNSESSENII